MSADRIPRAAPQRSRQAEPPRDDRAGTVGPDDDARAPFAQPTVFVTDLQADAAPALGHDLLDPRALDRRAGRRGGIEQQRVEQLARARERRARKRQRDGLRRRHDEPNAAQR